MNHALADLQSQVDVLWARAACAPAGRLLSETTRQDTCWYVEASDGLFCVTQWERGQAEPLMDWLSPAEAAHWVLADLAVRRAQAQERRSRGQGGYSRWNWIAPAIALMARISPDQGARLARTYATILTQHPLSDVERLAARYPVDG